MNRKPILPALTAWFPHTLSALLLVLIPALLLLSGSYLLRQDGELLNLLLPPSPWEQAQVEREPAREQVNAPVVEPPSPSQGAPPPVEGAAQNPAPQAASTSQAEDDGFSDAWPAEIQQWRSLIVQYSDEYSLDPNLVGAVMFVESWFNPETYPQGYYRCPDGPSSPSCTSSAGALGMMQVMPFHFKPGEDGRDPATNIRKGCAVLRAYLNEMGTLNGGLAAYNAGVQGARLGGGWGYAEKVLRVYKQYGDGE